MGAGPWEDSAPRGRGQGNEPHPGPQVAEPGSGGDTGRGGATLPLRCHRRTGVAQGSAWCGAKDAARGALRRAVSTWTASWN